MPPSSVLGCLYRLRDNDVIRQLIIISLLGYFFYEYGILVIERVYNILYPLYMAIFSLSFYALAYTLGNLRTEVLCAVRVPNSIRYPAIGISLLAPLIFFPLWLSALVPLIQHAHRIEFYYSIYILDLCFVMPAFLIVAYQTARNTGFGLLLTPALFIKGFTILFPLAIAELLKLRADKCRTGRA